MLVPIVPSVPHTTVVNKTIVYSDMVLPLKDTGNNLKVTSIENVSEFSLESCLKTIFESNPNVIFNTIQYSKNDETVYFYTIQDITTKAYEESKFTSYKPITSRTEILEEVKKVLLSPKSKDNNCISLYDVLTLLKKLYSEYENIIKKYQNKLQDIAKYKIGDNSSLLLYSHNFKEKIIHIGFRNRFIWDNWPKKFDDIYFAKQNGDLYVVKSESSYTNEILSALGSTLSEMYDELLKYADYTDYKYSKYDIKPVNSNFSISISYNGVWITVKYLKELELFATSYDNGYELRCNSSVVNEALNGKKTEIFKRIFVKISDCPEWSQAMLYEIRQAQLAEEQRIEDKLRYKEMRKEKRLALTRKIFPFLKK